MRTANVRRPACGVPRGERREAYTVPRALNACCQVATRADVAAYSQDCDEGTLFERSPAGKLSVGKTVAARRSPHVTPHAARPTARRTPPRLTFAVRITNSAALLTIRADAPGIMPPSRRTRGVRAGRAACGA